MNKIEVKILNEDSIIEAKKAMVLAARITQHGHQIKDMNDLLNLYDMPASDKLVSNLIKLPHPTLQKLGTINVAIVGASRRFLAQITRHQNEVKFMSASLQYSNYGGSADFVVPYEILGTEEEEPFLKACESSMAYYQAIVDESFGNDSAGYIAPQALRNILLISATPYQWKHMISQRICRRNTDETRYVMLLIWEALYKLAPELFTLETTGPFCMKDKCLEGKMSCGLRYNKEITPTEIIKQDFIKLYGRRSINEN